MSFHTLALIGLILIQFEGVHDFPIRTGILPLPIPDESVIVQPCDETNTNNSFIYCHGRLLHEALTKNLFRDSKTFVDKALKADASVVRDAFERIFPANQAVDRELLVKFVDEWFLPAGQELEECELSDWIPEPPGFERLKSRSTTIYDWAISLNDIWKKLCRKTKLDVKVHADRYSLLYVPNEFVIPGGRFREFYYWDAYWIIKGLLACGMTGTAKNMILNFAHMVDTHGLIPNGGRVYYLQRSQPPMLINMVYDYFEATNDVSLIKRVLPSLEKELNYWKVHKCIKVTVNGITYSVYQYRAGSNTPRPESYREDLSLVADTNDEVQRRTVFRNVASAAESGWDFSSRWFRDGKELRTIETNNIVEVDLNAFICGNLKFLGFLYDKAGNTEKGEKYGSEYSAFRETFQSVFYSEGQKGWYDFNTRLKGHNLNFYASNAVPLFTKCYHSLDQTQVDDIYNKMEEQGAFDQTAGIPTSMFDTEEQWDFPNGWSPLNHMIIEGLRRSDSPRMQQKAYKLAEKWILGNMKLWIRSNIMWEKYNVNESFPQIGTGGEYSVQTGFGWSNGVILDLLLTYADRITALPDAVSEETRENEAELVSRLKYGNHPHEEFYAMVLFILSFITYCIALVKSNREDAAEPPPLPPIVKTSIAESQAKTPEQEREKNESKKTK